MKLLKCILAVFSAAFILCGCFSESPESENAPAEMPEVTVSQIKAWQYSGSQELPGIVRPGKRAVLSTSVAGTDRKSVV